MVIGGGNAGLCAALSALRDGRSVLMIEKGDQWSKAGNSKYTRDIRYAHDADALTTGTYPAGEFLGDIMSVTGGQTNGELAEFVVKSSYEIIDFMSEKGVVWQKPLKGTLHLTRTNAFFIGGGKALVNTYYETARRRGLNLALGSKVEDLVFRNGAIESIVVSSDGGRRTVQGKAVVVASGGFEANRGWLKEYWGPAADNFIIRGSINNDGAVLKTLLENGARSIGDPKGAHAVAVDSRSPRTDGGIVTRVDSLPFGIVVDKHGTRFYDEGEDLWPKRYAIWGNLIAEQADQAAFSVVDSKVVSLYLPTVYPPYSGDSIAELEAKAGIDSGGLVKTVREFNGHVPYGGKLAPDRLDDCSTKGLSPPKSHWAMAIDKPPFYCYPLKPGITFTYMGVAVDRSARVLTRDGKPFENVFAAGEIMAGNILTRGYLAGFGLTIGTVFGKAAGESASSLA